MCEPARRANCDHRARKGYKGRKGLGDLTERLESKGRQRQAALTEHQEFNVFTGQLALMGHMGIKDHNGLCTLTQ